MTLAGLLEAGGRLARLTISGFQSSAWQEAGGCHSVWSLVRSYWDWWLVLAALENVCISGSGDREVPEHPRHLVVSAFISPSLRKSERKWKQIKKIKKKAPKLFLSFSISFCNRIFQHFNEMISHRYKDVKKYNWAFHTKLSLLWVWENQEINYNLIQLSQ